jgi:hypothetical protein
MSENQDAPQTAPEAAPEIAPVIAPVIVPPPDEPQAAKPVPPPRRGGAWLALGLLGFLILAAGEGYLYERQLHLPDPSPRLAALQAQIAALRAAPPAVTPPPATPAPAATDDSAQLATFTAQMEAIQTLVNTDHAALATAQAVAPDVAKLTDQLAAITAQSNADHASLAGLQASTTDLTKLTARITVLSRLESARMALDAGQPLGVIPDAPPALTTFAATPPPTEAALILGFDAAAQRAESASIADNGKRSFWSGVLARLEGILTISNGSHVIIGAPAAAVLAQARASLAAGDLAGAVAALDTLSATTQAAMGDWLIQARDLLAARQAITMMAGRS